MTLSTGDITITPSSAYPENDAALNHSGCLVYIWSSTITLTVTILNSAIKLSVPLFVMIVCLWPVPLSFPSKMINHLTIFLMVFEMHIFHTYMQLFLFVSFFFSSLPLFKKNYVSLLKFCDTLWVIA